VIAPASTGRESRSRKLVMSTDHTNRGTLSISRPGPRIFRIVVRKLTTPAQTKRPKGHQTAAGIEKLMHLALAGRGDRLAKQRKE